MVVIFIALFIIVCCYNFFIFSYQINGINRLVFGVPLSLVESSIDLYDIADNEWAHFDKETLEDKLTSYFACSMKHYVDDYTLDFYYYNNTNYAYCTSDKCGGIEITLKADLTLNYHYSKTIFYEIRSKQWMSLN